MRQSWKMAGALVLLAPLACGKIRSDKPETVEKLSLDEAFQAATAQKLRELDQRIAELNRALLLADADRDRLERELKESLFLKSWESIRSITPCGPQHPDLAISLGKNVAFSFISLKRLDNPDREDAKPGFLETGVYYFSGMKSCPFSIERATVNLDEIAQSALKLTQGSTEVLRLCWQAKEEQGALAFAQCSTVLGEQR